MSAPFFFFLRFPLFSPAFLTPSLPLLLSKSLSPVFTKSLTRHSKPFKLASFIVLALKWGERGWGGGGGQREEECKEEWA